MQIPQCPNCKQTMKVISLSCPSCAIGVNGSFSPSPLSSLDDSTVAFLEIFVLSRGNIKEMERVMNLSYPTVRAHIDALVEKFSAIKIEREQYEQKSATQQSAHEVASNLAKKY